MIQERKACGCSICDLAIDFEIDPHLVGEVEKQNCVIFAGAGVSTETGYTHPNTLYDSLRYEAKIEDKPEFWKVVDRFENQPNGRQKLVQLVKDRFDYIEGFRDLRRFATRFHRSLGNAPYFKTIITTNWDRYFEDVIDATPFVYDSDIPFWEGARRAVIKIHGSIDNYSSIVASSEDYESCERRLREGALGAVVKQIFATKTCIFCGFSAKDSDFQRVFRTIKDGLGRFARTHYLVSPFITESEADNLKEEFGIVCIRTDATHFIEVVKSHMAEKFCFSVDAAFDFIADNYDYFYDMHIEFVRSYKIKEQPHLIFCTAYQDGVLHAYQRILDRQMSGEFADLHAVQGRMHAYREKIDEYRKLKSYWDVAYFTGYQNGLMQFVLANSHADDADGIPMVPECFHPGRGEMDLEEFNEVVRSNPEIHKAALKEAKRKASTLGDNDEIVVQHLPWG